MTAPFPPRRGENCAVMGISSLPTATRFAGLAVGVFVRVECWAINIVGLDFGFCAF